MFPERMDRLCQAAEVSGADRLAGMKARGFLTSGGLTADSFLATDSPCRIIRAARPAKRTAPLRYGARIPHCRFQADAVLQGKRTAVGDLTAAAALSVPKPTWRPASREGFGCGLPDGDCLSGRARIEALVEGMVAYDE